MMSELAQPDARWAQAMVFGALEQVEAGLAHRVIDAALSREVILVRREREMLPELPLQAELLRLSVTVLQARAIFLRALDRARADLPRAAFHRQAGNIERGLVAVFAAIEDVIDLPSERARLREGEIPTSKLPPAPDVKSIASRLMPRVRVAVFRVIAPAVRRYHRKEIAPIRLGEKLLQQRSAALFLTAESIRVFFPVWGASTTTDQVRKSVKPRGK